VFGYVRPFKPELKVREYEAFRAAYCGLCHTLAQEFGFRARFVLNYDFTFLALLLTGGGEKAAFCKRRCPVNPLKKCTCCVGGAPFRVAAGYSVILAYWKQRDAVADSSFFRGLPARAAAVLLKGAYRRARRAFGAFDDLVRDRLSALSALERAASDSIDLTADKFACILKSAALTGADGDASRILEQLLYHMGRWIYLIDALDDLERDQASGSYNPLARRFRLSGGRLPAEDAQYLDTTLRHSESLVAAAFELMPRGAWSGVLENIIYLGLPWMRGQVAAGKGKRIHE